MQMKLVFFDKHLIKYFELFLLDNKNKEKNQIWLQNQDEEGAEFPADEVCDVIYNALNKYFKENH